MTRTNHHYVPQFYQRAFSPNKQTLYRLRLDNQKLNLEPKNIRITGAKRRLHSEQFEDYLSKEEDKQAPILEMINQFIIPTSSKRTILFQFLAIQYQRTLRVYKEYLQKARILGEQRGYANFLDGIYSEWEKKVAYPVFETLIRCAIKVYWLGFQDLKVEILKNTTSTDFIFSDHPFIIKNIKLNDPERDSKGFQLPGFVGFLPTNRNTMLMIYDLAHYYSETSNANSDILEITNEKDVDQLNKLQFYNCFQDIFSGKNDKKTEQYLISLFTEDRTNIDNTRRDLQISSVTQSYLRPDSDFVPELSFFVDLKKPVQETYRNKRILDILYKKGKKCRDSYMSQHFPAKSGNMYNLKSFL